MSILGYLEKILHKIDNVLLNQGYTEDELHQEGFRILGELYLLSSLERNGLLNANDSFQNKQKDVVNSFPTILSGKIDPLCSNAYDDLLKLRENYQKDSQLDILGSLYQNVLTRWYIQDQGIVFTPLAIVEYIISQIGFQLNSFQKDKNIIDLSCGSGIFLRKAAENVIKSAILEKEEYSCIQDYVNKNIIGFDIDPDAIFISHISLADLLIEKLKHNYSLDIKFNPKIFQTNSLIENDKNDTLEVQTLKHSKFNYVVGNPPYIESKIMDEETKQICIQYFPDAARGHFDVYSCFLSLGTKMLTKSGKLGYIIPNKFLSSHYAKKLREKYLSANCISQIVDLSHNDVFQPAVYPIILIIDNQNPLKTKLKISRAKSLNDLSLETVSHNTKIVKTSNFLETYNRTIFILEDPILDMVNRILEASNLTLGELVRFRWAISFHRKGLREMFVSKVPRGHFPVKFLGGKAFGGNREINRYNLNWKGYWIDYDHKKAKSVKNNFPDYEYFKKEKIIICQHALRIRATVDYEGFACKDIFIIGHLTEKSRELRISLEYILALLNSELYSHLYSNMYSSTEIMGKYLHYLPMYLHDLPVIKPIERDIIYLENLVKKRLRQASDEFSVIDEEIDRKVYEIYSCSKEEIELAKKHIKEYLVK